MLTFTEAFIANASFAAGQSILIVVTLYHPDYVILQWYEVISQDQRSSPTELSSWARHAHDLPHRRHCRLVQHIRSQTPAYDGICSPLLPHLWVLRSNDTTLGSRAESPV